MAEFRFDRDILTYNVTHVVFLMFLLKKFSISLAKDWFKSVESLLKCLNHRMLKICFGSKMYLNKSSNDQRVAFTKYRTFYHRIENCLDPRKILQTTLYYIMYTERSRTRAFPRWDFTIPRD